MQCPDDLEQMSIRRITAFQSPESYILCIATQKWVEFEEPPVSLRNRPFGLLRLRSATIAQDTVTEQSRSDNRSGLNIVHNIDRLNQSKSPYKHLNN